MLLETLQNALFTHHNVDAAAGVRQFQQLGYVQILDERLSDLQLTAALPVQISHCVAHQQLQERFHLHLEKPEVIVLETHVLDGHGEGASVELALKSGKLDRLVASR